MSVLVKNMEMPEHCNECGYRIGCYGLNPSVMDYYGDKRPCDCPLIEIPEHGDLIDQARLLYEMQRIHELCEPYPISRLGIAAAIDVISGQPVVIPAERSEE